jgi:mono/diheme cytochrome c family protein
VAVLAATVYLDAGAARPVAARQASAAVPQAAAPAATPRAIVDRYCVGCHNERRKSQYGNLALDTLDIEHPGEQPATWEKVVRKLRAGTMPPSNMPRPNAAGYRALIGGLEQGLDAAAAVSPDPGRTLVHRLNRAEYTNAVRDLLSLDVDGKALLPPDETGYGFDNIADVLTLSQGLMERYLSAARRITALAVGDPGLLPVTESYRQTRQLLQDDRMSDELPFGSRGGMAIRHYFPLDGEYEIRVKLLKGYYEEVLGLHEDSTIDIRIDGARVDDVTVKAVKAGRGGGLGTIQENTFQKIQVRVPVKAGAHHVAVSLRKVTQEIEGVGPRQLPVGSSSFAQAVRTSVQDGRVELGVAGVDIEGPFGGSTPSETPSRRQIFVCRPAAPKDEDACAAQILTTLAHRAYRRPLRAEDVKALVDVYRVTKLDQGFERGIQVALRRILVAPDFLFRMEPGAPRPASTVYRLDDVALASRLSFFLWSSIPDPELLEVAEKGRLSDPAVLEHQLARMLTDDKAQALLDNFFSEWLDLRKVTTVRPDPRIFPEFDENLRDAFGRETALFLESQLHENHSALDLLTANYTFLNERLARHYGIPNVYGSHFRRVTLGEGPRAGLLGQGSILTVTSYADRTSPVQRGKWLLQTLLGTPAPEPPPNVPPFPVNDGKSKPLSVRATMEQHRANAVCATCHSQIDPLGFALENFDAIGRWRTADGEARIDPSGVFPNGTRFDGPVQFRRVLLEQQDAFIGTLTEKLLTYALGRGLEYADMPAVRRIVRDASGDDYRWQALIHGVVNSLPFRQRRAGTS